MIEVEFNKNQTTKFVYFFTPARFYLFNELVLILDSYHEKCIYNNNWETIGIWDYIHGGELPEPPIDVSHKAICLYNKKNNANVKYIDVKAVQNLKKAKPQMITETGKNLLAIINKNIEDRKQKELDENIKKANKWIDPFITDLFKIVSEGHTTDYQISLVHMDQSKPSEIDLYKLGLIEKMLGIKFDGKTKIDNLKYESREKDMFAITINLKNLIKLLEGNNSNEH